MTNNMSQFTILSFISLYSDLFRPIFDLSIQLAKSTTETINLRLSTKKSL